MILGLSQLILLIPALWVHRKGLPLQDSGGQTLFLVCIVFVVIAFAVPFFWYRSRRAEILSTWDVERKITHYRAPLFFGWVLCEGANLVTLIAFMVTRDVTYLWLFAAGFTLYYLQKPNWPLFQRDYIHA
ncbi:MAG: hypothetical protein IPJ06_20460 [Saprospiraceae bacterium]|nr:hypothetical protein [Saprospiraceae bacterium]